MLATLAMLAMRLTVGAPDVRIVQELDIPQAQLAYAKALAAQNLGDTAAETVHLLECTAAAMRQAGAPRGGEVIARVLSPARVLHSLGPKHWCNLVLTPDVLPSSGRRCICVPVQFRRRPPQRVRDGFGSCLGTLKERGPRELSRDVVPLPARGAGAWPDRPVLRRRDPPRFSPEEGRRCHPEEAPRPAAAARRRADGHGAFAPTLLQCTGCQKRQETCEKRGRSSEREERRKQTEQTESTESTERPQTFARAWTAC